MMALGWSSAADVQWLEWAAGLTGVDECLVHRGKRRIDEMNLKSRPPELESLFRS